MCPNSTFVAIEGPADEGKKGAVNLWWIESLLYLSVTIAVALESALMNSSSCRLSG
jgi:hypothetical protein